MKRTGLFTGFYVKVLFPINNGMWIWKRVLMQLKTRIREFTVGIGLLLWCFGKNTIVNTTTKSKQKMLWFKRIKWRTSRKYHRSGHSKSKAHLKRDCKCKTEINWYYKINHKFQVQIKSSWKIKCKFQTITKVKIYQINNLGKPIKHVT